MTEKLKPCPFCGGEAMIISEINYHHVRCVKCFTITDWYKTKEEAIEAWNTRADSQHENTPREKQTLIKSQLRRLIDINGQITSQSQLLYQEIMRCQALIEQL